MAYVNGKPGPKAARCIERKKLSDLVQAQSDLMLKKLAQKLDSCRSTVHANLQVLKLGRKKNTAIQPNLLRQEPTSSQNVSKAQMSERKSSKLADLSG